MYQPSSFVRTFAASRNMRKSLRFWREGGACDMELSAEQIAAYDRDGFLVFPNLLGTDEVALLKEELARVGHIQDERVVRERTGGPRIVYGLHEKEGPTSSRAYEALVRSPRILQP